MMQAWIVPQNDIRVMRNKFSDIKLCTISNVIWKRNMVS